MTFTKKGLISLGLAIAALALGGLGYMWLSGKNQPAATPPPKTTETTSVRQGTEGTGEKGKDLPIEGFQRFGKDRLEDVTGLMLTPDNVGDFREALAKEAVWQTLGYSQSEALQVAQRFATSQNQAEGVLREIALETDEQLKVILLDDHVNIGTTDDLSKEAQPQLPEALAGYQEIELSFELGLQEIELTWEVEDGAIEASYDNEITGERLSGEKAQERVLAVVEAVDFYKDEKDNLFQTISQQLGIPTETVTEFSYEVTFKNNQKKEGAIRFH